MTTNEIVIREYRDSDAEEWLRVHAIIMTVSRAWNYCIQERPQYPRNQSTRLVATVGDQIIALTDAVFENEPGEYCFLQDSPGGYVLEFGRLPGYDGLDIGKRLIDATVADAKTKGYQRLEYWTQDRAAQRFYQRLGLSEIGRHYRFRFRPSNDWNARLAPHGVGAEHVYALCRPEEWPAVKKSYDVITEPPLEPRLCIGYELRW